MTQEKLYLLRLPDENKPLTRNALVACIQAHLRSLQRAYINGYLLWYACMEGCGVPSADVYDVIVDTIRDMSDDWQDIGPMYWEQYGVVDPSFRNLHWDWDLETSNDEALLSRFHAGQYYQGPDGRIFWLPVLTPHALRGFEYRDGQYLAPMVRLDPQSDYARALREIRLDI